MPIRSVRKPGRNSSSPASTVKKPAVLAWTPVISVSDDRDAETGDPAAAGLAQHHESGERGREHQE